MKKYFGLLFIFQCVWANLDISPLRLEIFRQFSLILSNERLSFLLFGPEIVVKFILHFSPKGFLKRQCLILAIVSKPW